MKLEIFKTPSVTEEPVRLILEASGSGITVRAVDSKGYPFPTGRLVTITPEGIIFNGGVNPALGFPLDDTGRLRLRRV